MLYILRPDGVLEVSIACLPCGYIFKYTLGTYTRAFKSKVMLIMGHKTSACREYK